MNPSLYDLNYYDYELPPELIAQSPASERSSSRLLDYTQQCLAHLRFMDLTRVFPRPVLFVRNSSKVLKARLFCSRESGARIEVFFLRAVSANKYEVMVRPARRVRVSERLLAPGNVGIIVLEKGSGTCMVSIDSELNLSEYLDQHGEMPLPPYITSRACDESRYQTVYARQAGSVAAPTAGLHFTDELLQSLKGLGHEFSDVLLHVGAGTFKGVDTADIRDFQIHSEQVEVSPETASRVLKARQEGVPVVAVGTTALRSLETAWTLAGPGNSYAGDTNLYLVPGAKIHSCDYLITNFHLPRTSLLILVSAFLGGNDIWRDLYQEAIRQRYRFFSFGDAMVLPNLS